MIQVENLNQATCSLHNIFDCCTSKLIFNPRIILTFHNRRKLDDYTVYR